MVIISYPSFLTYVLGAQKNRLTETVLLSTHNISGTVLLSIQNINKDFFVTRPAVCTHVTCNDFLSDIFYFIRTPSSGVLQQT